MARKSMSQLIKHHRSLRCIIFSWHVFDDVVIVLALRFFSLVFLLPQKKKLNSFFLSVFLERDWNALKFLFRFQVSRFGSLSSGYRFLQVICINLNLSEDHHHSLRFFSFLYMILMIVFFCFLCFVLTFCIVSLY